jgi:hypothetical protein
MGIEVAHTAPGVSAKEFVILEAELKAIQATEARLRVMEDCGGVIRWDVYPEGDGRFTGSVYDSSGRSTGVVVLNRDQTAARVTSYEALRNESSARAAAFFSKVLRLPIAAYALEWRMSSFGGSGNLWKTGPGISVIGPVDQPVILYGDVKRVGNKVVNTGPPTKWLAYTEHEWRMFIEGAKNNEFNYGNPDEPLEARPAKPGPRILTFGGLAMTEGERVTYVADQDRIDRWSERSTSGQGRYTEHFDFVLRDFLRQRQAMELEESMAVDAIIAVAQRGREAAPALLSA